MTKAWIKIPLYHYISVEDLKTHLPYNTPLVGVEMTQDDVALSDFKHPPRADVAILFRTHNLKCF